MTLAHGLEAPSAWVQRWSHLVRPGGTVLDIACGRGRHLRWFAQRGHPVTGVDRAAEALSSLTGVGELVLADIEEGPWPLMDSGRPRLFDAVVVTNYLWRALMPTIQASLAPGGVLIYETFASGNETVGKPSRPDFLLRPGELLTAFAELRVIAYEDGFLNAPERFVQRLVAIQPAPSLAADALPARYRL